MTINEWTGLRAKVIAIHPLRKDGDVVLMTFQVKGDQFAKLALSSNAAMLLGIQLLLVAGQGPFAID